MSQTKDGTKNQSPYERAIALGENKRNCGERKQKVQQLMLVHDSAHQLDCNKEEIS
jgi:hypothetical protein